MVKNLPAIQESWIWSLTWEDPLEKQMAIHFSILIWRIPWTEDTGSLQSMGYNESDTTGQLTHTRSQRVNIFSFVGHTASVTTVQIFFCSLKGVIDST